MPGINKNLNEVIGSKEKCGRLRVLIIGRANAGKTTICQKMSNATQAAVARDARGNMVEILPSNERGIHDINMEIIYPDNPGFVFHDSCGLEPDSDAEKATIFEFIRSRSKSRDLSKQLHCIWFCIPMNDARPWVEAEQSFFSHDRPKGIPIVLIFTKCDALEKKYLRLQPRNLSFIDQRKYRQKGISDELEELKQQAMARPHGPDAVVQLKNMHKREAACTDLMDATIASINIETLKMLLPSAVSLNAENVTTLHHIEDLQGKNVVLLFGKTRAGKSTFINDAYGKKVVKSTASITSDTDEISYVNEHFRADGHELILVDTIGLGGSGMYHDRISFAERWLRILHPGKNRTSPLTPTVKAILYFIDIMDGAMNEDNIRNLETFKALVGEKVLGSVVFVTTKWVTKTEQGTRKRLEKNFFGWEKKVSQDFPGSSILRLDDTTGRLDEEDLNKLTSAERINQEGEYRDNAMRVLRQVLAKTATQPLLVQEEMYAGGKNMTVGQTTLGKTIIRHLSEDLERIREKTLIERLKSAIQEFKNMVMSKVFFPRGKQKVRGNKSTSRHELRHRQIV